MLKKENRYDAYVLRVSTRKLDSSVTTIEEGQFVTLNANGKVVISDGTKKSFIALSSARAGRNNVAVGQNFTYGVGAGEYSTDQYDSSKTYTVMCALKINSSGKLEPLSSTSDTSIVAAYAMSTPVDGFLRILTVA